MAKKVKFPLKLADGTEARTLEELKEHFDINSVVAYFSDGKLLNWLQARYYDDEADKVSSLAKDDKDVAKKLCAIFDVESEEDVDPEEIARRQERLNRLKQYTDDRDIWERVDQVAFDQEDLGDLLDEDMTLIYLCNNRFTIPLRETHKTYIGVGKAVAVIRSNKIVDFDALNIEFKKILFDENYAAILKANAPAEEPEDFEDNLSRAKKLYEEANAENDPAISHKKFMQAAELGYPDAFWMVGLNYETGLGVDEDIDEARRWYKRGMEKNNAECFAFYALTFDSDSTDSEKREAFRCMKRATELNSDRGDYWYHLGEMHINGFGTRENLDAAVRCYEKGIERGDSFSANELGEIRLYADKNPRQAFKLFKKAVELDESGLNTPAMVNLANCYCFGEGVSEDKYEAFELYKRAAEAGSVEGMKMTGLMYYKGEGTRKNTEEFFRWTNMAAEKGDTVAMTNLAYHYKENIGNYGKAFDWYKQAADAGNTSAMNEIGWLYDNGQGVNADATKAFNWFLKAAQAEDFDGMANAGTCYLYGHGTDKNLREAERWLKKSAEGGNLDGMVGYGDCLQEKGNVRAAIDWYERAAKEGSQTAQERLDEIQSEIQNSSAQNYSSSRPSGGVWEATTTIRNRQGIHARPASIFVQKAASFISKIQLKTKGKTVDAKSILMIMSLGIEYGDQVTIVAEGPDARQAVNELRNLIDSGFGER